VIDKLDPSVTKLDHCFREVTSSFFTAPLPQDRVFNEREENSSQPTENTLTTPTTHLTRFILVR
jgi:hypothetical protein